MMSITSTRYLSNVDWLQDVVQGTDLILCGVSALEYAQNEGQFDNIEYHIVNSFDDIEYLNFDGVLCTTVNQTINDMLSDYDNIDELAFLEALSNYYFANNESFDNLKIKPNKLSIFNRIKQIAINYYCSD